VIEGVYGEFLGELKAAPQAMKLGDPLDEETAVGPVVNSDQYEGIVEAWKVAKSNGRVVQEGGPSSLAKDSYYIEPFIIADVDNASKTAQEEIFTLIVAVIRARDFDHAVEIANYTRYGLTAGIAATSLRYAHEFAERAEVGLVNVPTVGVEFQVPFGGNSSREAGDASKASRP
jgi:alpha-ketoglutaric semialdehyde dehydrogenase